MSVSRAGAVEKFFRRQVERQIHCYYTTEKTSLDGL